MSAPTDKLGRVIHAGDIIAYGHAFGRCAGLRIGKVLAIKMVGSKPWEYKKEPQAHFTVRGVDDDWPERGPELCAKNGTLMYADRIIVLDRAQVPAAYLELLDGVS